MASLFVEGSKGLVDLTWKKQHYFKMGQKSHNLKSESYRTPFNTFTAIDMFQYENWYLI